MKTINSIILSINLFNILCYNVDLIQGIRGGIDVPAGKFTYQAIVLINNAYACGGAVINADTILSAGQCVLDEKGYFFNVTFDVIVGVTSFHPGDTDGKIKVDYIYVKNTFRPQGSSPAEYSFPGALEKGDLSILKLRVQIRIQPNVNYVEIPRIVGTAYLKYTLKSLNMSGFGLNTGMDYESVSNLRNMGSRLHLFGQLTYTQAIIQRDNFCQNQHTFFFGQHICTISTLRGKPTGPCFGDAGGPLVYENIVVGVMQHYVDNCDNRYVSAIYTRVASFIPFIENARDSSFQSDMRLGNYTGPYVIEEPYIPLG